MADLSRELIDGGGDRDWIRDVGRQADRSSTESRDPGGDDPRTGAIAIETADDGTIRREPHRGRPSDPRCSPGHEGHSAIQWPAVTHGGSRSGRRGSAGNGHTGSRSA